MQKKVALLHSVFVMVEPLIDLFKEHLPDVKVVNIVDDSILPEVMENGGPTPNVVKRVCRYVTTAEEIGCDLLISVCTTMADIMDLASKLVKMPILKIDEPMVDKALEMTERLLLVATFEPTLEPSSRFIQKRANELGKDVSIKKVHCKGAFEAMLDGDKETHDRIVVDSIKGAERDFKAVILAQGSMAPLRSRVEDETMIPVFASPLLAVLRAKDILYSKNHLINNGNIM